jgi:hypothetical protein
MLNGGVLRFAANGRIRNTTAVPTDFNGGTPTVQGLLSFSPTLPERYSGGFGYRNNGAICVSVGGAVDRYVAGLPLNTLGQLCATQSIVQPATWVSGIPLGLDGLVALAIEESPATLRAFSNAFSSTEFD